VQLDPGFLNFERGKSPAEKENPIGLQAAVETQAAAWCRAVQQLLPLGEAEQQPDATTAARALLDRHTQVLGSLQGQLVQLRAAAPTLQQVLA